MTLDDQIVAYLRSRRRPVTAETVRHDLSLAEKPFKRALRSLVRAGRIRRTASGRYGVPSQRRRRACLGCGKMFTSTGPGNRLCSECGERTTRPACRVHVDQ